MLEASLKNYVDTPYSRVRRGPECYEESSVITIREIDRLVEAYHLGGGTQTLRLMRDAIDHWLRRYHGYRVQASIGAHYKEVGTDIKSCIFEHVIPASKARDLLIKGVFDAKQAMNIPTCLISKANDALLRKNGLTSSTPDYWNFFKRYNVLNIKLQTHDNVDINQETWNLEDHFNYFKFE
jgi:hypothetical protein